MDGNDYCGLDRWRCGDNISAYITAAVTAYVNSRKADKTLAVHEEKSNTRKAELAGDHRELLTRHNNLSKELSDIQADVTFLKDGRIADEARREAMKKQELDPQKALDTLHISLSQMADVRSELDKAKKEIAALQKENASLQQENAILRRKLAQSQDRDEEELEP